MNEDELRALLTDRAGGLPDNPTRVADVRSRIAVTRRRRAGGTALALVLLAVAGLVLTRLPGRPDALPTGVPPGPWFSDGGYPVIPGYTIADTGLRQLDGPTQRPLFAGPVPLRHLVLVRCTERGTLLVRNIGPTGEEVPVECTRRAGDHFEGAAVVEPDQAERLFTGPSGDSCCNVEFRPGPSGRWEVVLLVALAPDRLGPWSIEGAPLVDGARNPEGATVTITVPRRSAAAGPDYGFQVGADCVLGVQLTLTVPRGTLAVLTCDSSSGRLTQGSLVDFVDQETLDRLGLERGQRVTLTVRSTGARTDQWRLYPITY